MAITESNLMAGATPVGNTVIGGTSPTTPGATTPNTSPASPAAPQAGVTVFKVDGMKKSIAGGPVTGFALHQVAGFPDKLETVGGQEVKNDYNEFKVLAEMEFVTKFHMAGADGFNPEHKLDAGATPRVDPPHSQTISGVNPEEPTIKIEQK